MNSRPLAFSLNTRIRNKPPVFLEEYTENWQSTEGDLLQLLDAIRRGHAFIGAAMLGSYHNNSAFLHSDLAIVDVDHGLDLEGFREHQLAPYACLVYTSPSHRPESGRHRFRVLFRLPERVADPDVYKCLITALIRALGGDSSCSDPCRIFYGNSRCEHWLGDPGAMLPTSFLEEARKEWLRRKARYEQRASEYDDATIAQAIHVLDHVLPATADGERNQFVRITAAAASAGDALFATWSDWASRGHHGSGKNRRQASERFFRGFSGNTSLATLFFLASEHDPNWRDALPESLRTASGGNSSLPPGYRYEDLLGCDDPDYGAPRSGSRPTPSLLDLLPHGGAAVGSPRPSEAAGDGPLASPPAWHELSPDDGDPIDPTLLEAHGDTAPLRASDDAPMPDPPKRKRAGKGSSEGDDIARMRKKIKELYPGLRLNLLTQNLECGPASDPVQVDDADTAYLLISEGEGKVFPKTHVYDAIRILASRRSYNPIHSFLDECSQSEPIDYLDTIASTLLGVPDEGPSNPRMPCGSLLADLVIKRFLIAAVARARQPGCSLGWMPILVGPQNVGKSNFFQYLTPPQPLTNVYPWCPTIQQGISYLKERPHALHGGWIINLDEVERFFRRQYTEEFKNLVTVAVDRSRRLYENERLFQRAFVLVGCTNNTTFMVDPTGNRRFMAVNVSGKVPSPQDPKVKIVDLDRVKEDRMRIWAAAQQAYLDAPVYEFSSYEISHLQDYLSTFTVDSPLTGALQDALARNSSFIHNGRPAYVMSDIFRWLEIPLSVTQSSNNGVADELKRLGYVNIRARVQGRIVRFWQASRPSSDVLGLGLPLDWGKNAA